MRAEDDVCYVGYDFEYKCNAFKYYSNNENLGEKELYCFSNDCFAIGYTSNTIVRVMSEALKRLDLELHAFFHALTLSLENKTDVVSLSKYKAICKKEKEHF